MAFKVIRKLVEGNYLVIYRIENWAIQLLAIVHGARRWKRIVRKRL